MATSTQKTFAHVVVAAIAIPAGLLLGLAKGGVPQLQSEILVGLVTFAIGLVVFVCSRYEWYWDTLFTGYYRGWNNPAGRAWNTMVCIACMALGLAMLAGFFPMQ